MQVPTQQELLKTFILQFTDFLNDLILIFPNDVDLQTANKVINTLKKSNPKALVKVWKIYVVDKYEKEIMVGNIDFFLEKDYRDDLNNDDNQQNGLRILEAIDRFRQPIRSLSQSNKEKSIQYIQNLTQLASAIM